MLNKQGKALIHLPDRKNDELYNKCKEPDKRL